MRTGDAYATGPLEQDSIIIRVYTRERLRALGFDSYDEAIGFLLTPESARREPPAGAPKGAELPSGALCGSFSTKKIRGVRRPCRVRGPHELHRYWSPYDNEVTWR